MRPGAHPTQMPLELALRIVLACSNPDDLLLDGMCGAGTSLVAARELGRRAIGIEQRADYAAIARERLGAVTSTCVHVCTPAGHNSLTEANPGRLVHAAARLVGVELVLPA